MTPDERCDWREIRAQIEGVCMGIIFCSWYLGATPEDVALIRFPATLLLTACLFSRFVIWAAK